MSTASQIEAKNPISTPEKSDNLSSQFLDIPSCTIEDVDRALFDLFDKSLPLLYTQKNDTRRVPIVFATGERFALIARKQPLRDRSKALILPVISIMRSGLSYGNEMGASTAPDIRHVIKRQLSPEDPIYQRLVNRTGLKNSDDLVSDSAFLDPQNLLGAEPGRLATRRPGAGEIENDKILKGDLLSPELGNNIYEIYEMPAPVYFTATYEITIWTQYVQEMNNMLGAIFTENHFNAVPSYRIETDKGYYFVAYFEKSVNIANNFEDFSEDERIVRTSLTVKVPGYFLGGAYKGSPNKIRRYVSSPQVSFDMQFGDDPGVSKIGIPSGNPDSYVLSDMLTIEDSGPGQFIGLQAPLLNPSDAAPSIGGYVSPQSALGPPSKKVIVSPFAGKGSKPSIVVANTSTTKKGEKTFRQIS